MTRLCNECGAETVWDDDAGSDICMHCGTLSDPSQTLLTAQTFQVSETAHLWDVPGQAALKSHLARGNNWDIPGQGKEVHNRRNHLSMTQFINSLCASINAPGLSPRAITIFNQAMTTGKFRWGRKAKLVAGASLTIALREYRRPDSLNDIAYLLNEQYSSLVRTLTTIVSLLNITLTPVDPSVHIPPLLSYLSSLSANVSCQPQSQPTAKLPVSLISQLKSVPLRAASNTAAALSTCLTRLGPDHTINSLPSPPTAIALFLLAIEAELRSPLDHLGELAECLGVRCHKSSRGVVMARYKLIQDEIATWIDQVPWLGKYEKSTNKAGANRAKTSKRSVVARGIPDVLQFQEGIWRSKLKPALVLEIDSSREDEGINISSDCAVSEPATKRQKFTHCPLRDATQFLLNPISSPLPKYEPHPRLILHPQAQQPVDCTQDEPSDDALHQHYTTLQQPAPFTARAMANAFTSSLPTYILTAPDISVLHTSAPPTRLQLLTAARGAEQEIDDDELFEEGELEGMLRTSEEAEAMKEQLLSIGIWEKTIDDDGDEDDTPKKRSRVKSRANTDGHHDEEDTRKRKTRVDLDALARFMRSSTPGLNADNDEDEDEASYGAIMLGLDPLSGLELSYGVNEIDEPEDSRNAPGNPGSKLTTNLGALETPPRRKNTSSTGFVNEDEVVVSEWRPLSPEVGFGHNRSGQYEEEYTY